jgi:hypothetical protein
MLREMHVRLSRTMALAALLLLLASAGGAGFSQAAALSGNKETPPCHPFSGFESASFSDRTVIDNEFFPLVPGTHLSSRGWQTVAAGLFSIRWCSRSLT